MTYFRLNTSVRRTKRVVQTSAGAVETRQECSDDWFLAEMEGPTSRQTRRPEPRRNPATTMRYKVGQMYMDNYPLKAAEQVETKKGVWELLEDPRPVVVGTHRVGWEVRILLVSELYPLVALVSAVGELDGSEFPVAIYDPRDQDHRDTGMYTDYVGDAPIEAHGIIKPNTQLTVGGDVYKVTSAVRDRNVPHLELRLRHAGITS